MKELVCILSPNGCRLRVEPREGAADGFTVTGNLCNRGETFAITEMTAPRRSVTTTVRTTFPGVPVLPVRTAGDIPKASVAPLMRLLAAVTVDQPIRIGETVVHNALGLGVDVIASSDGLENLAKK
jgi:CxxC motif-containing protein